MATESANPAGREQVLDEVLTAYLKAVDAGQPPDRREVLARHPELAPDLERFFADHDAIGRWTEPLGGPDVDTPPDAAGSRPDSPLGSFGDYELLGVLGRGGMGAVYKARQRSLNRPVALKVIRAGEPASPADVRRFRTEAEVVAQLEHPNIVPVHEVGERDGLLFLSMRLVEGGSLADQLDRFAAEPRVAAQLVADVARAVHFAHQRGVLHRDLKPGNVLLDADGRPLVTDFGLAKRVQGDSSLTQSGAIVGTPSYLAPEQASGTKGAVTTAADVWGLGATLYALLTGRPPFRGETVLETLEQVKEREPEPPRRGNPKVDRDLETICLKCLAKEAPRRYASALALAEDIERFLGGKPIQARPVGVWERGIKWVRRRPLAVAVGGLVLAMLLLGGAILVREAWQRAAIERAVEPALERAELLQEQERYEEALGILTVAEGQLEGRGLGALRERVNQRKRDVDMLMRLEEARLRLAFTGQEDGSDYAGADRLYAAAFKGYDLDVTVLDPEEAARLVRASAIRTHLIAGLDDWASIRSNLVKGGRGPLLALADLADDDPWRRRLRELRRRPDGPTLRTALEELAEDNGTFSQPPANLVLLAINLNQSGSWAAAERLLRKAQQRHPESFWVNFELAFTLLSRDPRNAAEAVRFYQAALALQPRSPAVYVNLGTALHRQGKSAEAFWATQKAIELKTTSAEAYNNFGAALLEQKKPAEAITALKQAIEFKPNFAEAYFHLGQALRAMGKLDDARTAWRKAVELKPDFAEARWSLGINLGRHGDFAEALEQVKRAQELGSRGPGWPASRAAWVRRAEVLAELDVKLPKILRGEAQPRDMVERIDLAEFCFFYLPEPRRRYLAAVQFYTEAFAADPKLADNLGRDHLSNAATAAFKAALGQGLDAGKLDERERARLRAQALDWVRADLARWRRAFEKNMAQMGPALAGHLRGEYLQGDHFAVLRDDAALSRLPAEEREAWRKLRAELEELLTRAGGKVPGPKK
jgi:serine/threonine-protein kinase